MSGNGLNAEHKMAIKAAKRAFGEALTALCPPDEATALAMTAYTEGFCDLLAAAAGSDHAAVLVAHANRRLGAAGLQIVALHRMPAEWAAVSR